MTQVSVPHDTVPVGKVVGTDPIAGTPLPRGSTVTLQVSSGPSTIPMPNVVGAKRADAEALLNGTLGLNLQVSFANGGAAKKGLVLTQSPAVNTPIQKGSTVAIVVGL